MHKQMPLQLNTQSELRTLWEKLPEQDRKATIEVYARLIARAAKMESHMVAKEKEDEQFDN